MQCAFVLLIKVALLDMHLVCISFNVVPVENERVSNTGPINTDRELVPQCRVYGFDSLIDKKL